MGSADRMIFYANTEEVAMKQRIIKIWVLTSIALFGLRGVLPDIANEYGTTALFLALVIIPVGGTVAYEIAAGALRKMSSRKVRPQKPPVSA
jgi:hypothetical protein